MTAWHAQFVAPAWYQPGAVDAPAGYLRHEVELHGVRSATLHVTALGLVEPWVNGIRVGDEVLAPGWTSYDHRLAVSSHDVTKLLQEGVNALGIVLGDGWAVGRVGWEGRRAVWADRPAAFVQLEVEDDDGRRIFGTDASWRAGTGGVRANSLFDGELFDARLEPDGWAAPGFDDAGWAPVDVVERDLSVLLPRTWEPVRRVQELPAREVLSTPSGATVVDFGQNISGWVRLRVRGDAGTTVILRHAETLVHGEIDFETNRGAKATDTFVLRGEGEEIWEPRFTFHGFRYVQVDGWPGELHADQLTAVVVHSDMERSGWFESSHDLLNQLHSNVVWSMRDNFVAVPTDCPQRDERAGWTGDLNAFATTGAFLYDVRGILGSWLADLAADQRALGSVPFTVPNVQAASMPPTALWSDVAVSLPWVLYQEYGDVEVLERQYTSMTDWIDQVEALLDENGLWSKGFQFGDWLDPDAPPSNPAGGKTDSHLVGEAFLVKTTREMALTASTLGKTEDASRYWALHERVRKAFRDEWVTPLGRLANETQTAYSLCICFGILEDDQLRRAGDRLDELVAASGYRIATGFAGTPLLAHALTLSGHLDTAYRLVLNTECPSFLYPVTMGATTIWERWDAVMPDGSLNSTGMTSLNHYALGAIADWLHRVVAGLNAGEPGYRTLLISPQPGGGLTRAAAAKQTAFGRAAVAWWDEGQQRTVEVTIPDGCTARVVLPGHPDGLVEKVGPGEHAWSYELLQSESPAHDLDTPMRQLQEDPAAWAAVMAVFEKHFPGATQAGAAGDASSFGSTLRDILVMVPAQADTIGSELLAALSQNEKAAS